MTTTRFADHDIKFSLVAHVAAGINARSESRLPGVENRGSCNARMSFSLEGRTVMRYFVSQSDAIRTKASYRGIWRAFNVQYWNNREMIWC